MILIIVVSVIGHFASLDSTRKVPSRKRVDDTWHHSEPPSFKPVMHPRLCDEPQKQRSTYAYDMLHITYRCQSPELILLVRLTMRQSDLDTLTVAVVC